MSGSDSKSGRQVRTSVSHPLRIDQTPAGDAGGLIGITFCPGKHGPSYTGFTWNRDLGLDLDAIAVWRPAAVVTLIEDNEFAMLSVPDLGPQVRARGIEWHHLPIKDVRPPDQRFESAWVTSGPQLRAHLVAGRRVLVHCRGGLGRAGTVSARLLVELGVAPRDAVRQVKKARPGAIETPAQESYVLGLAGPTPAKPHSTPTYPSAVRSRSTEVDWFERLTGFREDGYASTQARLAVEGRELRSLVNGQSYGIGELELLSLADLRQRAQSGARVPGRARVRIVEGDVRLLHQQPAYAGALFQVASQFNLLEMTGPEVTPERGVTCYQGDPTQGPACAIAAGAATVYRNYFAPVGDQVGQTRARQLDGFADLGAALALIVGRPPTKLWTMRNGYAMFTREGVDQVSAHILSLNPEAADTLRRTLRIGIHWDVNVTDAEALPRPIVSQAFCSALPVSYNNDRGTRGADWGPFASLVLEAAYEATLWAAVANAQRGKSNVVLLTSLGGGAFGNDKAWILAAMRRAIGEVADCGLDIVFVSYGRPASGMLDIARDFA